jgi:hypothetical protein
MSVSLSIWPYACMEQLGSYWTDFFLFEYFFKISYENSSFIKIWQQQQVFYMKIAIHLPSYLAQFLEWEMFHTKVVEKIKTHFMFNIFFFKNCATYEIMWKNTVAPDRPQMTIWRVHIVSWIPKTADRHLEYVIRNAFPQQQRLHGCTSMLRYMYIACLIYICLVPKAVFFNTSM